MQCVYVAIRRNELYLYRAFRRNESSDTLIRTGNRFPRWDKSRSLAEKRMPFSSVVICAHTTYVPGISGLGYSATLLLFYNQQPTFSTATGHYHTTFRVSQVQICRGLYNSRSVKLLSRNKTPIRPDLRINSVRQKGRTGCTDSTIVTSSLSTWFRLPCSRSTWKQPLEYSCNICIVIKFMVMSGLWAVE